MSADGRDAAAVAKEIRFSVVMYGGVSLAIYMNGVTQELLHMVRATARDSWDHRPDMKFRFKDESDPKDDPRPMLKSTETFYRKLANLLNDDGVDDVRFIIDVISGTSAGGINGIFLAKALSDDRLSFDLLKTLWINEGAIENLLNDRRSQKDVGLPVDGSPKSLLCSDRMYVKLLSALTGMLSPEAAQQGGAPNALVREIDLFATSTDINGRILPLRLADMLVWERKFKTDFHFHRSDHHDDFVEENNPFLAFVARCTSSFPFAFEPMQLSKLKGLRDTPAWPANAAPATDEKLQQWQDKFFDNSEQVDTGSNLTRPFGDGGYLNNAPFYYVVKMLGRHGSSFPTDRKLLYVEPSPKHPELDPRGDTGQSVPNAVVNSYDALIKLPGEQPIRDDLQRVIERNRTVRKVQELSALLTTRAMQLGKRNGSAAEGAAAAALNTDCIGDFSYLVLRVYAATDDLSKVMSEWLGLPSTSSLYYGLRCVVRAWRETQYRHDAEGKPAGELVDRYTSYVNEYDLDFEKRKFRFQRQQINMFYCFDQPAQDKLKSGFGLLAQQPTREYRADFREALMLLKQPFNDGAKLISDTAKWIRPRFDAKKLDPNTDADLVGAVTALRGSVEELKAAVKAFKDNGVAEQLMPRTRTGGTTPASRSVLEFVLGIEAAAGGGNTNPAGGRRFDSLPADNDDSFNKRAVLALDYPPLRTAIAKTAEALRAVIQLGRSRANAKADAEWEAITGRLRAANGSTDARMVAECYRKNYELFDTALFPLLYDTEVGTPELISIVRVSPDDAKFLNTAGSEKLAGNSLGHFGAFLDRSFRTNDILWGRLDGAERIVRSLISPEQKAQGDDLIGKMQDRIISEFLEERKGELGRVILDVAKSLNDSTLLRADTGVKAEEIRRSVAETVAKGPMQLYKDAILGYLSVDRIKEYLKAGATSREPNRKTTLESMTRTIRIVGEMLEGLSKETKAAGGFLIRVATALWWLVEAAVPNGLQGHFFRKFFAMAFWLEILMVIGGTIFSQPVQAVGLKLLAFTALLWLVKDALYRYLVRGRQGLRVTVVLVVLFITVLAMVMVITPATITENLRMNWQHFWMWFEGCSGCTVKPAR
jgi:patatin-related protein